MRRLLFSLLLLITFHSKAGICQESNISSLTTLTLMDAIQNKEINVEMKGAGLTSVNMHVKKQRQRPLRIIVPVGTLFINEDQSYQNMISLEERIIRLTNNVKQSVFIKAASTNAYRNIPNASSIFNIRLSPGYSELQKLSAIIESEYPSMPVSQAAVWIVTNDIARKELDSLLRIIGNRQFDRITTEQIVMSMNLVESAGIDITNKTIFTEKITAIQALTSLHEEIRESALRFLNIKADQIEGFLIALSSSGNEMVRESAVSALGSLSASEGISVLIDTLYDESGTIWLAAKKSLVELGPQAVEPLLLSLRNNNHHRDRLISVLGEIKDSRAVAPLIGLLKDQNHHVREQAVAALGKIKEPIAIDPLSDLSTDQYEGVQMMAVKALANFEDPGAAHALIKFLNADNKGVKSEAVLALVRAGDIVIDQIIKELVNRNNDYGMRSSCADTLAQIKDPKAVQPLIETLKSVDSSLRGASARALGKIKDLRAVHPLINALGDSDALVRLRAVQALAELKSPLSIEPLINALQDNNQFVSHTASFALKYITGVTLKIGDDYREWRKWWEKNK
jgi:HEAT repeat protein